MRTRKNRTIKRRKTKTKLPKLRKIDKSMKKFHYKIKDPFSKRKLAIHDGVKMEAKKKNGYFPLVAHCYLLQNGRVCQYYT